MSQILRGVEEVHLAQRIFNSERLEHRDHRGDADTGGDENERVFRLGVFKRKPPVGAESSTTSPTFTRL